jgi:peptidoglycan/xylan/chitin deacetylase (PgdA/CDA1 family)
MIIFHGDTNKKEVALLFDDGPNPLVTPRLLKVLEEKGVPANFFLIGMRAEESPEIVKQILASGHEIGNHSYTHKRLTQLLDGQGPQAVVDEVMKGKSAIEKAAEAEGIITFFRPPYLDWNEQVAQIVEQTYGDNIMMSSLAIGDWDWGENLTWQEDDPEIHKHAARIIEGWRQATTNGTLLGFHDSSQHNLPGNTQAETWMNRALPTLEAIGGIVDFLIAEGFQIKRLSDMQLVTAGYARPS